MNGIFNMVDESNFRQPDMGAYYDEDLMEEFYENVDPNKPTNAAFYVEEPFSTKLGYHPEYEAFVIKANPYTKKYDVGTNKEDGKEYDDLNKLDGDTTYFRLNSVEDGNMPFSINGGTYKSFQEYCMNKIDIDDFRDNVFGIRHVGINAPEIPHYFYAYIKSSEKDKMIKSYTYDEFSKAKEELIYEKNKKREPGVKYLFVKDSRNANKYREVIEEVPSANNNTSHGNALNNALDQMKENETIPETIKYKVVSKDDQSDKDMNGSINMGIKAQMVIRELLERAEDIRVVVDAKQLIYETGYVGVYEILGDGISGDRSVWELIMAYYTQCFGKNLHKYPGFTTFGQDTYKRFLGAVYVKTRVPGDSDTVWININKYLISELGDYIKLMPGLTPKEQSKNNNISDAFKVWSYNNKRTVIADGFFGIGKDDFDDRRALQKEITGHDFATYRDYTVMIGDCLFMVPPTSIRVVNQIDSERVSLLRSKSSITKTKPHTDRILEMTLYFNGEHGINGVPITKQLPCQRDTDDSVTYHMNGLRSLIAMFKYTPFMPIENAYINDDLGIEAVSLANLQIQTMPMYPQCVAVTLTLQQFNYRVYLNELPPPSPEAGESFNKNMFATSINYEVMRHYYQKAIQRGEELKDLNYLSSEYIDATMGNKTSLIPMKFRSQNIEFSILDKDWLDKLTEIKELAEKRPLQQTQEINDKTTNWAMGVGISLSKILPEVKKELDAFASGEVTTTDIITGEVSTIKISGIKYHESILNKKFVGTNLCPFLTSIKIVTKAATSYIHLEFDSDSTTIEERTNLMKAISKELDLSEPAPVSDGIFKLEMEYRNGEDKNSGYYKVMQNTEVYKVASFFATRSTGFGADASVDVNNDNWNGFAQSSNEQYFQDMKDNAIDITSLSSARFIPYPLEDIVAQQFSISMGNVLANTKLKAQDGYAPQLAGGQDTIVDFMFHTKSRETVNMLNAMQSMAADHLLTYRKVISCWPIRIGSEMTKLCGINEVAIESIDISTVPMQPGLFAIQVRAISLDRTMRDKEALRKIDNMNNSGAINQNGISSYVKKTYFDLSNTLSKAEVYPDLELPTIDELEEAGFKYIRYMKKKKTRIYPDPDFYFVYAYAYSSQVTKKSIVENFKKTMLNEKSDMQKSEYLFGDKDSKQTVMMSASDNDEEVISYKFENEELREQEKKMIKENMKKVANVKYSEVSSSDKKEKKTETTNELYKKGVDLEKQLLALDTPTWDVCKNIKCTFKEKALTEISEIDNNAINNDIKVLSEKIVKEIDGLLKTPIKTKIGKEIDLKKMQENKNTHHDTLISEIKKYTSNGGSPTYTIWSNIFKLIGGSVESPKKLEKMIRGIFEASAMALSGNTEYYEDANKSEYQSRAAFYIGANKVKSYYSHSRPDGNVNVMKYEYVPYSVIVDKYTGQRYYATSREDALDAGITFGQYQIAKYDRSFLEKFYKNSDYTFGEFDFLDPYYNKSINKNANHEEYMTNLMFYPGYSVEAFGRITLLWVKNMIENDVFLSCFDARRKDIAKLYDELDSVNLKPFAGNENKGTYIPPDSAYNHYTGRGLERDRSNAELNTISDYGKSLKDIIGEYEYQLAAGKLFAAACAAVTHGDYNIYGKMLERDILTLTSKTRACQQSMDVEANMSDGERGFRKLIRGLVASEFDVVDGYDEISSKSSTKLEDAVLQNYQKLWITASQDPSLWVLHSFYDMIVNDKRGRMARAFPTYYMLLIDEGREIGYWKLHDNFYNISSIAELEVVKSRKMPADTARIVMTNMFKSFTTEDEEIKTDYEHNIRDVFTSIFSPRIYFQEEEKKRTEQMDINRATIRPGARIHLRMGYSGDAAELPILFNGVVAEVNPGEIMELIAQGDGHEISNPGAFANTTADDAADLGNESSTVKWFTNIFTDGATPKQLIQNIFTTKSGVMGKIFNWFTNGRFFNDNMFGMSHFGEIDYKDIHANGEIMQNIFEGEGGMPWHKNAIDGSMTSRHYIPEPPIFTVPLEGKSVWDVMNVCASTSLEFITGVATFGLRSTLFHGRPHYYYAYDYDISDNGRVLERRKPYQQYHIIDSFSDIIGNHIKASGRNVKTVAVPTYHGPRWIDFFGSEVKQVPNPLFIDWDIYPEYQKSVTVKTEIAYKGTFFGKIIGNKAKDKWSKEGGERLAWRAGATYLKESVKDMYEGEVAVIGDPSIKPLDRVMLYDIYEDMNGMFEVEAIVHRMTPESGYTSSIYADCISCIDNRYEEVAKMWISNVAAQTMAIKGLSYAAHKAFGTSTRPTLNYIAKVMNKGAYKTAEGINWATNLIGKEDLIKYASLEDWSDTFYKAVNLKSSEIGVWSSLKKLDSVNNIISAIDMKDITTASDLIKIVKSMGDATSGFDPEDMAKTLEKALKEGNIKKSKVEDIKSLITNLRSDETKAMFKSASKSMTSAVDDLVTIAIKQLDEVDNLTDGAKSSLKVLKAYKAGEVKDISKVINSLDSVGDILEGFDAKTIKAIGKYGDDVVKAVKNTSKVVKGAKVAGAVTATAGSIVGGAALATSAIAMAVEIAITYVLTKSVSNWIENLMASFNVLSIYPLKRNGLAYVAGIDGHKGLVVGSPSWNKEGPIDKIINWAFEDRGGILGGFLDTFVFSEEMKLIAQKYNKKNGIGVTGNVKENSMQDVLSSMAESTASAHSAYRSMILAPRIESLNSANAKAAYNWTRVLRIDDPMIAEELVPITPENTILEHYFINKKLMTKHSMELNNESKISRSINHKAYGTVKFNGIYMQNKTREDIPFLRPEAFQILNRFIEIVEENASDNKYGDNSTPITYLKSGTIVSENTWNSTGHVFVIDVPGVEVEAIFKRIAEEFKEVFVKNNSELTHGIFEYRKVSNSTAYEVFVSPRDKYIRRED